MEKRLARLFDLKEEESNRTVRDVLEIIKGKVKKDEVVNNNVIHLGHGDPSSYPSYRTTPVAEQALVRALTSSQFNGYGHSTGIPTTKRAVAEYLSRDLPYKLSEDDIYLSVGANHGIEILLTVLAQSNGNILLPRPGYPLYEARAAFSNLEVRHFDLLPEKKWEVDLDGVETLADDRTIAMVIINPGNPCGSVYTFEHLQKIAETAKRLGILVIADEVYSHLVYGRNPFIPMGAFGNTVPVLTVGSMSKRWLVPGWRVGWIAATDPNGVLKKSGIAKSIERYLDITADSPTLIQGAIPEILEKTTKDFFSNITFLLSEAAEKCYAKIAEIPSLACIHKPEGAMSTMVKLNLPMLHGIEDDMDFALKLAHEESVLVLPGSTVGLKNWFRLSYAVEDASLEDGLNRIKAFCSRRVAASAQQGSS